MYFAWVWNGPWIFHKPGFVHHRPTSINRLTNKSSELAKYTPLDEIRIPYEGKRRRSSCQTRRSGAAAAWMHNAIWWWWWIYIPAYVGIFVASNETSVKKSLRKNRASCNIWWKKSMSIISIIQYNSFFTYIITNCTTTDFLIFAIVSNSQFKINHFQKSLFLLYKIQNIKCISYGNF